MTSKTACYEVNTIAGTGWVPSEPEAYVGASKRKQALRHGAYIRSQRGWDWEVKEEQYVTEDVTALLKLSEKLVRSSPKSDTSSAVENDGYEGIPLYRLLEVGSSILAILSIVSLTTWVYQDVPLVHPLAALLCLVASPFLFLMGRKARAEVTSLE